MAISRYSIDELVTLFENDQSPVVVVEGWFDQRRYKLMLSEHDGDCVPNVLSVDSIDVPDCLCHQSGYAVGNRGRVLALASQEVMGSVGDKVLYIIDSDEDYFVDDVKYPAGVVATDFPSFEAYYAHEKIVFVYLNNMREKSGFDAKSHASSIVSISRETLLLRMVLNGMAEYRGWPRKWGGKCIVSSLAGLEFQREECLRRCLGGDDKLVRAVIDLYEESESQYPRGDGIVHGHDFACLLGLSMAQATGERDYQNPKIAFPSLRGAVGFSPLRDMPLESRLLQHCFDM